MEETKILGVKINSPDPNELIEKINLFLDEDKSHYIVTTNPEFIIEATKDNEFKKILNEADLSLADGFGIKLVSWLKGKNIKRISGVDLMLRICQIAEQKNSSIFLLGSLEDTAERAALKLVEKFNNLNIVGAEEGIKFKIQNLDYIKKNEELLKRINKVKPDIIFVAFGAPKQEKWIYENKAKIPSLKLAMGVGGTFDFIAKKIKRAPKIWRLAGLEWLWRLIMQPWRLFRIIKAVIYFPYLFIKRDILKIGRF